MSRTPPLLRILRSALVLVAFGTHVLHAQEINTNVLSENGWFSDDTRADGSGSEPAGTDLVSNTLTDDPEATATGSATHDADILAQIAVGAAPSEVPAGTHPGAVHLSIAPGAGAGKSQISHRKDDLSGHGPGSIFGPGFMAEYSWMGDGTPTVTASLKFGIKTAEFGLAGVSSKTGENAWDKVLIYEPGNGNGKTSDGLWHTETIDFSTGKWWFFDRTVGAGTIGMPLTLSFMSTSTAIVSGFKTVQDVYDAIVSSSSVITSVQFGIGSGNAGGSVFVNELTTNAYRPGMTTTFGCPDTYYANDFEVDDFGWNVFAGPTYASVRVPSGTNGVTSASGAWHCEAGTAAGNWGGYSACLGCASTGCAGPVSEFPTGGYVTSIDIYLDVDGGFANDTRFDFSSAINDTAGVHRRDFIFNGAFLDSSDLSGPGAGTDRFLFAASNNAPGWPQGGVDPVAITASGWYTFEHVFRDGGSGVLACDFRILDAAGTLMATWTRSDASDVLGATVGGNRYGWFVTNGFPSLAFDNAERRPGDFDQDVTPDVIFGSGNANGSFTVDRSNGVELGLRGKLRYPASNIFHSNGDGSYTFNTGSGVGGPAGNSEWSFEWSINSDFDGSSGWNVGDLTYEIGMDNDPGTGTDLLLFDPVAIGSVIPYAPPSPPVPYWDHSMGDNNTPNGGGLEAGDPGTYAGYLSSFNVAQNSWKPTFYQNTSPYSWDPDVPGFYEYSLAAFDGANEVARTAITLVVVDGITLSLEADPCQQDADPGTAGVQLEVELWMRNPDDEEVTGYQAFLEFDSGAMTYEGALSSYSPAPFPVHIQPVPTAEVTAGRLRLDGNTGSSFGPDGDALLATLLFTVDECDEVGVDFDLTQPFFSELSFLGLPLTTDLLDSATLVADDTAPVLAGVPADIVQPADAGSCSAAVVTWSDPTATDNCDPAPTVVCSPPSGSSFPVGTTSVTCTATDECGNVSSASFDVTVTATNAVDVIVQLQGSMATSRCIRFVMDDCGSFADVELTFTGSVPAVAVATVEVPCGVWTEICAKDQQHTLWDTSALIVVGNKYVATTALSLEGGDTDDDGDVDINDVTLYLAQFGSFAADGDCPWDGVTRDTDFSNDGAVGSEDYAFLTANWLSTSSCDCSVPDLAGRDRPAQSVVVHDPLSQAADLNRDGVVDVRDVEVFEGRFGFTGELSRRMWESMR